MVCIYFCCNKFHPLLFVFSVFLLGSFAILEQCQSFVLVYLIVQCKNQPVSPNQNVMSLSPSFYQSRLIVALSGNGYFWTVGTSAAWIQRNVKKTAVQSSYMYLQIYKIFYIISLCDYTYTYPKTIWRFKFYFVKRLAPCCKKVATISWKLQQKPICNQITKLVKTSAYFWSCTPTFAFGGARPWIWLLFLFQFS